MIEGIIDAIGVKDLAEIGDMELVIIGNKVVVANGMLGLLSLSESEVAIKASKHQKAIISGEMLEVVSLSKNDISVKGRIFGVRLESL